MANLAHLMETGFFSFLHDNYETFSANQNIITKINRLKVNLTLMTLLMSCIEHINVYF